jgi:transcription-repair coupling factor (superfamily II helicase)
LVEQTVVREINAPGGMETWPGVPRFVVVTPNEGRARELAAELDFFLGTCPLGEPPLDIDWGLVMPDNPEMVYGDLGPDMELELERMAVCFRLSQHYCGPVLFLSAAALSQKVMGRADFDRLCDLVGPQETLAREKLVSFLDHCGYRRMPLVEDPGCYAVRGAIVDIYTPACPHPCRIEFEDDRVISVRLYDEHSQRTTRPVDQAFIHPVRQTVLTPEAAPRKQLARAAEACGCPSSKVRFILEQVRDRVDFFGSESLLPVFHQKLESLERYIDGQALWLCENQAEVQSASTQLDQRMTEAYTQRLELNRISFPPRDFFVSPDELNAMVDKNCSGGWTTSELPALGQEVIALKTFGHQKLAAEIQKAAGQRGAEILAPLAQQIRTWNRDQIQVLVASSDRSAAQKLASLLRGYGLEVVLGDGAVMLGADGAAAARSPAAQSAPLTKSAKSGPKNGPAPKNGPPVVVRAGRISGGFVWPEGRLAVVDEQELFGVRKRRRPKPHHTAQALSDLSQLGPGDYVVHDLHGVGRYGGLTRQVVGNIPADFLAIEYAGGDKLYLPVHRFDQVRKHVGAGPQKRIALDRLGGATWQKRKRKVAASVRQLAEELLKIQAQRNALPGHAFPAGGELLTAFETTFPFEETPDQAEAIDDTLTDMMADRPMDRLVCGDVGYGKTEVALRAAVTAVLGSKQVAVLAPTTVLVEQHTATFEERLRSFPITVEGISRFRPRTRQQRTLEALAAGRLDIIIGTHRLLSSDVQFKNLGLVIIDEEQRFGVKQKERLKNLRTHVDVLSLTATPIPRTMQMAITGIKDLSIIATPPPDRQSIRTYVCPQSPLTISRAIRQETARGGQVFVVVPRIGAPSRQKPKAKRKNRSPTIRRRSGQSPKRDRRNDPASTIAKKTAARNPTARRLHSMEWWQKKLAAWVPEVDVAVAHGQMESKRLEKIMVDFVGGKHDVLLCTSLIESGLDIPRANTMLIMHADHFGLAQLYQLRGRVGRSRRQAYCYFMVDSIDALTEGAKKRLSALERLSQLGSSYNLASEDLEIRGAGDVLGKKQSGHVAAVGYDTYFELLEEAVAALKGEPIEPDEGCDLSYDLPAFIPDDWMPEPGQRLHYYAALARAGTAADIDTIIAEMEDLFGGPIPVEVQYLAELSKLKQQAHALGARRLELSAGKLVLSLEKNTPLSPKKVLSLIQNDRTFAMTPQYQLTKRLSPSKTGFQNDAHPNRSPVAAGKQGAFARLSQAKNALQRLGSCVSQTVENN